MNILGISCFYHDAAAALVKNGLLTAACSEERFTRIKQDPELPKNAVDYCLKRGNLTMDKIDYIVFYDKPFLKFDRILTGYMSQPFRSYKAFLKALPVWLSRKLWTDHVIYKELGFDGEVLFVPHHLSHAAGTYFSSDFDDSAILTIDGVGEWATASYGIGEGTTIKLLKEMHYPHSVGLLYSAFTYYLGFQVNSAEYKVMGLAPYGKPVYADLIEEKIVKIHDDGSIHLNLDYFSFHYGLTMTNKKFEQLFNHPRREPEDDADEFAENIAASIQVVIEKIVLKMAAHVRQETGKTNLCLSGGVALNCKANGLLLKQNIFDNIYVQPASGDAGGAVGCALYASHKLSDSPKQKQPFFGIGPGHSENDCKTFLDKHNIPYISQSEDETAETIAKYIAEGNIVAVYQGAMEFGPRALGFRSILADPRDNSMKEKINAAVKYREPFRPFAPVVLKEDAADYFDCMGDSPYMLFNFEVNTDKRSLIPAVTHIDNSSRIQTVTENDNKILYKILCAFKKLTGLPVLLNTSFNLRGHAIVNKPEDAFATFCSGGIDKMLLQAYIVDKTNVSNEIIKHFIFEKKLD